MSLSKFSRKLGKTNESAKAHNFLFTFQLLCANFASVSSKLCIHSAFFKNESIHLLLRLEADKISRDVNRNAIKIHLYWSHLCTGDTSGTFFVSEEEQKCIASCNGILSLLLHLCCTDVWRRGLPHIENKYRAKRPTAWYVQCTHAKNEQDSKGLPLNQLKTMHANYLCKCIPFQRGETSTNNVDTCTPIMKLIEWNTTLSQFKKGKVVYLDFRCLAIVADKSHTKRILVDANKISAVLFQLTLIKA